jgi:hypothetical protein
VTAPTPAPTPAEQATLDRFEAGEPAPESLRERVARAIHGAAFYAEFPSVPRSWDDLTSWAAQGYRDAADVTIAVMRGES